MKQIALSKSEETWLDTLAEQSDFWSSVRAKYAEFDGLTERQYDVLREAIDRNAWRKGAARINGEPIRNKYRTERGAPRCAYRATPCKGEAIIVVGQFAYCGAHVDEARAEYAAWQSSREQSSRESKPTAAPAAPKSLAALEAEAVEALDVPF